MNSKAIHFYGIPGAGKGTQANLLAHKKRFVHLDTGQYMQEILYSNETKNDPILLEQRKVWDRGDLNDPKWALSLVKEFANNMETTMNQD
jgi:adenylate kinase family enzyme